MTAKPDKSPDQLQARTGLYGCRLCEAFHLFVRTFIHAFTPSHCLPQHPVPLGRGVTHPTVPVFLRWQVVLTCPWKCSLSCRQASGVYHWKKTDRRALHPAKRQLQHQAWERGGHLPPSIPSLLSLEAPASLAFPDPFVTSVL